MRKTTNTTYLKKTGPDVVCYHPDHFFPHSLNLSKSRMYLRANKLCIKDKKRKLAK